MSHIVQIQTEVRDAHAVSAACERLSLAAPQHGRFQLFSAEAEGLGVQLPDWRYPAVCELSTGAVKYDNFGGRWGDQRELERFLQIYAVEVTKLEARKKGYAVTEQPLQDGSIRVQVVTG